MNYTDIDWPGLTHTWNPVFGCLNKCWYCYAWRIAFNRLGKDFYLPKLYKDRLKDKQVWSKRKSYKIFVGSMADMWGHWVPAEWIMKVLKVCGLNPQHTFMFLTKNPARYLEFVDKIPNNCQLGATITADKRLVKLEKERLEYLYQMTPSHYTFVSIEPLLGEIMFNISSAIDLLIVGAMTDPGNGKKPVEPRPEWIEAIKRQNIHKLHDVHYKKNIQKYMEVEDVFTSRGH